MKKGFLLCLMLVLILSFFCIQVVRAMAEDIYVEDYTSMTDMTFYVPISLNIDNGDQLEVKIGDYSSTFKVKYDPNILECIGLRYNQKEYDLSVDFFNEYNNRVIIQWNGWNANDNGFFISSYYISGNPDSILTIPEGELFAIKFKALKEGQVSIEPEVDSSSQDIFAQANMASGIITIVADTKSSLGGGGGGCFINIAGRSMPIF